MWLVFSPESKALVRIYLGAACKATDNTDTYTCIVDYLSPISFLLDSKLGLTFT